MMQEIRPEKTSLILEGIRQAGKSHAISERAKYMKEKEARLTAGSKRLSQLKWPANWTRRQKRLCVAACKRAIKKGYTPDSPEWKQELRKAGFK